ncbi:MAG: phosphoribosyltransferase family protein [Thermodesulfobacteriota bacterium]
MNHPIHNVFDRPDLRGKTRVFRDRRHAGEILGRMLQPLRHSGALMLAVPAGGLPVADAVRLGTGLPLDVAVVSKITLPWNTEAGYGAVAFDGTVRLNPAVLTYAELSQSQIEDGKATTLRKVRRRVRLLRGGKPFPEMLKRAVVLVDDGLASGFTMLVAVESVKNAGAGAVTVAVPTGHRDAILKIASQVDALYCPNIRSGMSFAVADAYERWHDVTDEELLAVLKNQGG